MTVEQSPTLAGWGRVAYEAWATIAPTAFGFITDPSRHFSMMGQQAADRVEDLATQIVSTNGPRTFAETVSGIEVSPDGKLRAHQRFARFTNVSELVTMLHTYGDIKTAADLDLPTPAIAPDEDGNHRVEDPGLAVR